MDFWEVGCGLWAGSLWLRIGQVVGACEFGNEPWGSIKFGDLL